MKELRIEVSENIEANPADVYAVLADYSASHLEILPARYFPVMEVERGGQGAGTIVEFHLNLYGMKKVLRQIVSEPQPGRVLVETDAENNFSTTFSVDPINGSNQTRVTITTIGRRFFGFPGMVERLFLSFILRKAHREMLARLAEYSSHGL